MVQDGQAVDLVVDLELEPLLEHFGVLVLHVERQVELVAEDHELLLLRHGGGQLVRVERALLGEAAFEHPYLFGFVQY